MMYKLQKQTVVNTSMERAWEFIKNPANLNLIVPDDMKFTIVSDVPDDMYEGMHVEYRVRIPLLGRRKWVSELINIVPGSSFVDRQLVGPYKLWHHYHMIEPVDDGVRFVDIVTYEMPFGFIGTLAHALFVGRTLERIFSYREKKFRELLPAPGMLVEKK
jgi:ligand-binding SRPBCC domain-containing protein